MFTFPIASMIRTAAVAAVIGGSALGTAGLAQAERPMTETDREFLQSMVDAQISFDSPATVIDLAGTICGAVADGYSYGELFDTTIESTDLTADQADALVSASVWYYCPAFIPDLAAT